MEHIVVKDMNAIAYGFVGIHCGWDQQGRPYIVTATGRLVIDDDGHLLCLKRKREQRECVIKLVRTGDPELAGAIVVALGLDVEVPL